jgi:hypothetical protein
MSKTQEPNKGGRPPADTEAITLRLPRSMIAGLDEFRKNEPDLPGRPEGLRRILRDWLIGHGYLKD